jgi:hypothetical protein
VLHRPVEPTPETGHEAAGGLPTHLAAILDEGQWGSLGKLLFSKVWCL